MSCFVDKMQTFFIVSIDNDIVIVAFIQKRVCRGLKFAARRMIIFDPRLTIKMKILKSIGIV